MTDDQNIVLTLDWTDQSPQRLYSHVRMLIGERDKLLQQWVADLGQEISNSPHSGGDGVDAHHLAVEAADWKAKLRKQKQELYVK